MIWNLLDKKQEAVLNNSQESIKSIAISNNDKFIVCGSSNTTIKIWDLIKLSKITVLESYLDSVNCVAIITDNKFVVSGSDSETNNSFNDLQ